MIPHDDARIYPCAICGTMRSKDEGGTVFTVCDGCWGKRVVPQVSASPMTRDSLIVELGKLALREHHTCEEDEWYSCPLSPSGSANYDAPKVCNCGADAHNAKVAALLATLP